MYLLFNPMLIQPFNPILYTTILAKIHVDTARTLVTVVTSFTYKQEKAPPPPLPPSSSQCWLM